MLRPSSWLAPRSFRCSTAEPTRSSPDSQASRRGRPSEHSCSRWRLRPVSIRSSTCTRPPPDATLRPRQTWPLPWLPGIPEKLHEHPAWGDFLTKRSRLVADLAQEIRDHACQEDAQPVWAAPGSYPSTALVGEVAIWRAANGVDQRDPRPTGGVQLETAPTLWQQHLDRAVARLNDLPGNAQRQGRPAARTTHDRNYGESQRPYQASGRRPSGPSRPGR